MTETVLARRERARVPALAMANRFTKYAPETEKMVRDAAEVAQNPVIEAMKKAWKHVGIGYSRSEARNYKDMLEEAGKLEYTAKDVELFSLTIAELREEHEFEFKTGLFLSALINNGKEQEYVLHIPADIRLERLAYRNTKNITINGEAGMYCGDGMRGGSITINGDAGAGCGRSMRGGSIIVNGNAGAVCGEYLKAGSITVNGSAGRWCGMEMKGGSITVNGDAGEDCGLDMKGGSITVKGKAVKRCGRQMKGGEMHLDGSYDKIADTVVHGKIFHKGELIVDK